MQNFVLPVRSAIQRNFIVQILQDDQIYNSLRKIEKMSNRKSSAQEIALITFLNVKIVNFLSLRLRSPQRLL